VAGGLLLLLLPLLLLALLPPMPVVLLLLPLLLLLLLKPSAVLALGSVVVVSGCGMPAEHNAYVPAVNTAVSRIETTAACDSTMILSSLIVGTPLAAKCTALTTHQPRVPQHMNM
jgi:hypothetical protein